MAKETDQFEGLALHDQLPLAWEPSELINAVELDHANQETARALQALAVFEEAPREPPSDTHQQTQELHHLEAKVDVLLSLVIRMAADQKGAFSQHSTVLRATSLEWTGPDAAALKSGDTGYAVIYPNPLLPLTFRLPSRVVGIAERSGTRWLLTRFENIAPTVSDGLEKLIFRRHRRQIAIAKGTGVHSESVLHSETGVFHAGALDVPK
ncbi:MAG: PilZ domain-containing protein [Chlorobiales bacterium]|nr:PilZ domain-containing protein [Chlorobiales bacterium]